MGPIGPIPLNHLVTRLYLLICIRTWATRSALGFYKSSHGIEPGGDRFARKGSTVSQNCRIRYESVVPSLPTIYFLQDLTFGAKLEENLSEINPPLTETSEKCRFDDLPFDLLMET